MRLRLKKLNNLGVAHHLLLAVAVVVGFASFGAYRVFYSGASPAKGVTSYALTVQKGCELAGRPWDSAKKKCKAECTTKSQAYKKTGLFRNKGYCVGNVENKIKEKKCVTELKRIYVKSVGCARKADQKSTTTQAPQCQTAFPNYSVKLKNNTDYCVSTITTSTTGQNSAAKPLLDKPATMSDQEWASADPRYGMSFSEQARYYKRFLELKQNVQDVKNQKKSITIDKEYNYKNWQGLEDYYKKMSNQKVSMALWGLPRWWDSNTSNDNLKPYNASKKWLPIEDYGACVDGVQQISKAGEQKTNGFNPNYFSSYDAQMSWIKSNGVLLDTRPASQNFGTKCELERKKNPRYVTFLTMQELKRYYYTDGSGPLWGWEYGNLHWDPSGSEPDYLNLTKPSGWNPSKGNSPFSNIVPFLK